MILLNGHSLTPARKVPVEAMSLTLKERESTASLTPADMTGIGTESWFLDDQEPGAGIVWRVRSIGTAYATQTPTVQLEHVISTLKDKILFGETTPATIAGGNVQTCTARQAVEYILRQQSDWVLGDFDFSVTNAYKFDGDSLFDCLETVTGTLDDAWWSYDLSRYPFRLNITRKSSAVGSELRCGRNLRTITRTIDKGGMYTRFYPIGKDDLHLAGTPYVERNANLYGVIEHTETDTSRETDGELRSWANEKLSRHAEPVVNIDVEGMELVESTGEPLDKLLLGRMCRVPLPEFGTTITERIVSLTYQDKVHQPEVVRITLANNRDDIARIIAENAKAGSRGGRGAARQAKEDHAWFEDTDTHVAMCAEGIVGTNPDGTPNWARLSQIIVDGTGIHQMVQVLDGEMEVAYTKIDQNENAIILEAQRASAAEGALSGRLTVAADAITAEVNRATGAESGLSSRITVNANSITTEVTNRKNADTALSSRITQEADRISLVVEGTGENAKIKPASIVAAINAQTGSSKVTISADEIDIDGVVSSLASKNITCSELTVTSGLYCESSAEFDSDVSCSATISCGNIEIGDYDNVVVSAEVNDNTLTLTFADGDTLDFSKATTLSGEWSGTVAAGKSYKVTASPQGTTHYSPSLDGMSRRNDKTWATNYKSFDQTIYVYDEDGTDLYEENMTFSTTESYNAGVSHADSLYSKWNNGVQSSLYYWDTASLSYKQATGGGKYWFYKSSV